MSGNGTDQGHVIAMLQQVIVTLADHGTRFDRIERDLSVLRHDVSVLTHDVSVLKFEMREVKQDITNLQQTVADYHGAVVGHGIAVSEHDFRLGRLETHLSLPPARHT